MTRERQVPTLVTRPSAEVRNVLQACSVTSLGALHSSRPAAKTEQAGRATFRRRHSTHPCVGVRVCGHGNG